MIHGATTFDEAAEGQQRESSSSQSRSRSRMTTTRCKTSSSMMASRGGDLCWDNLSLNNADYVERQRHLIRERNSQRPIYNQLNKNVANLGDVLQWTVNHIELPFTWPTQFNDDGQEHIVFEEDKVKVPVDVQTCKVEELGRRQVEDIVHGWIKHLKGTVKELQERQAVDDFTPMAEYELWREREIKYNTLLEQLKHPFVRQTIGNEMIFLE